MKVVLKVSAIVFCLFFFDNSAFLCRIHVHTVATLALLFDIIFILLVFEFLFLSVVPGLIWEFVEFSRRGSVNEMIPKVISYKFVALNEC